MAQRTALVALALLWSSTVALAQPAAPAKAPPPKLPAAPQGVKVERDIAYVPGGDSSQTLDLYLPEQTSDKPLPLIIYIHGGGWRGGSKNGCPPAQFVTQGYAAASVEYRFSQKALFPAQIQDCQAAVRFLRANAKKYNIDPDHFGVWGESAGGHLVALLGTTGGQKLYPPIGGNDDVSDRVQAVCDVYGPADFAKVAAHAEADKEAKNIFTFNDPKDPYGLLIGGGVGTESDKTKAVSPFYHVTKDAPPFLVLHGTKDTLVPFAQSVELVEKLKAAGVDATLQKFPGAGHGGAVFWSTPVRGLVKTFFDKHLRRVDVKVETLSEESVTVKPAPAK
jgi:acetyl esterase/lipase